MREDPGILDRECAVLTRFLIGAEATPYVVQKYRTAHELDPKLDANGPFEARLLSILRRSRWLRRPVAAYSRIFMRRGVVHNKLILLVAILESSSPTYAIIDAVPSRNAALLVGGLAWRGVVWLGAILVGVALLWPLRWVTSSRARST